MELRGLNHNMVMISETRIGPQKPLKSSTNYIALNVSPTDPLSDAQNYEPIKLAVLIKVIIWIVFWVEHVSCSSIFYPHDMF